MFERQMRRLGDLIDIKGGLSYKSKYIDSGDAKLLGMGCVSFSQRFLQSGCRSYAGEYTEKHLVDEGDLVIATRQQSENLPILGYPAMIPSGMNGKDIIVGTNLYKVDNQSNFSNSFLFWLMRSDGYRSHVKACASGSTVRMITKDVVLDYCFACPTEKEAEAIATFLDRIEDKIELNQKMNQTLEEVAKAIFQSWFVDFDPVRAKAEGRPTGLPPEISDLFPDELVDSELGAIPKYWQEIALDQIFIPRNEKVGDRNIKEFSSTNDGIQPRDAKFKKQLSSSKSKNKIAYEGDFIFGMSREVLNFGLMQESIGGFSSAYKVYSVDGHYDLSNFIYKQFLARPQYYYQAVSASSREGQSISQNSLFNLKVVLPSEPLLDQFYKLSRPINEKSQLLIEENSILSELRDTLLPKLISGELKIPDAEKFLEEAGI